jgi:hypothetical protein
MMTYREAQKDIELMKGMIQMKQDHINEIRQNWQGVRRSSVSADLALEGELLRGYKDRLEYAEYIILQHEEMA